MKPQKHAIQKSVAILFFTLCITGLNKPAAQAPVTEQAILSLESDQRSFSELVLMMNLGVPLTDRLIHFCSVEVDSLKYQIMADSSLNDTIQSRAINSIGLFIHGMRLRMAFNMIERYDLPGAIESYKILLNAILYQKPYDAIIGPLSQMRTRLLAHSFEYFKEYHPLLDMAKFKSTVATPENIIKYLESDPGFRYFDSLLLYTAAKDPVKLAGYVKHHQTDLARIIRTHKNEYIRQIVLLADDPDMTELMPFIVQLAENSITRAEILEKRKVPKGYFQFLVNTLKDYHANYKETGTPFHQALHNGIREKSISFYVNQLNDLHESPKEIRFSSIKDLRMEDIYYIMTSSGNELYTSSYLGLYRSLMEYCKKNSTDSLFRIVHYDRFRDFIKIAANYNTLSDFFSCFAEETSAELLKRYISRIEEDTYSGLEKAMDVADCYANLSADSIFSELIRKELQANYQRCLNGKEIFGEKLYDILLKVLTLAQKKNDTTGSVSWVGYNERLLRKDLQNENGEIIGLVLFFGDEDGRTSFKNFRDLFTDPGKWETTSGPYWIRIRSLSGEPVIYYANLPLDHETDLDLQAQDSLSAFLEEGSLKPVILVHRGHSYYINYTMRRMQESVKLVILGACGGNNYVLDVANISPQAQMVFSRKIGAMGINDPIIDEITNKLVRKKDLVWKEVWNDLENRFRGNPAMLSLFREYISPQNNISIFVLNLFNRDN